MKPMKCGWFEEYHCGCVSPTVATRKNLPGYCPTHGDDRRGVFREGNDAAIKVERETRKA